MNIKLVGFFLVMGFTATVRATCDATSFFAEFKPGAYIFSDKTTRNFFHTAAFTPELEVGVSYKNHVSFGVGGQYVSTKGHALLRKAAQVGVAPTEDISSFIPCSRRRTKLCFGTLFFPVKFHSCFDHCLNWYIGGGPKILFAHIRNCSPYVSSVRKTTCGGFLTAGLNIKLCSCLFTDIFFDYSLFPSLKAQGASTTRGCPLNVNGLAVGLGIGVVL